MYCWGSTAHGELGLGGIEEEQILTPTPMTWSQAENVVYAACGDSHSMLLTSQGQLYSCGNNDHGQLGHDLSRKRPQPVTHLEAYRIAKVACGSQHSLAVNEWGQIFSWGSDEFGQLGQATGQLMQSSPKIIKKLATQQIVQIAAGANHSFALTLSGDLYTWGANGYGQLGLGHFSKKEDTPTVVASLAGIPIIYIAAGANHTFAISRSGAVFGWGKNSYGQLGLNDVENRCYPTHLKSMRSVKVCHVSCGEDFTVYLTLDGGVFTCGLGQYGQLGHGIVRNELLPKKVLELMGSVVTQTACGRRHMVCAVGGASRLVACGLGAHGQLGLSSTQRAVTPQAVRGPWLTVVTDSGQEFVDPNAGIGRIFAGGDHCFALIAGGDRPPYDARLLDSSSQILKVSISRLGTAELLKEEEPVDQRLLEYIETVFRSLACMNNSFLSSGDSHYCCNTRCSGVDMEAAERAFGIIASIENVTVKEVIFQNLISGVIDSLRASPPDVEVLRVFLTLPLYHEMRNPKKWNRLQAPFAAALNRLKPVAMKVVVAWWTAQPAEYLERLVDTFKTVITFLLIKPQVKEQKRFEFDSQVVAVLEALANLNRINFTGPKTTRLPAELFHIPELCDYVDIRQDYLEWLTDRNIHNFYLCNYPFLFDAACKTMILQTDQAIQMHSAMNAAATAALAAIFMNGLESATLTHFLTLSVSRDHIVQDTLRELQHYKSDDLKRPLKVKFYGEEAEDAGGVKKEFFILLLREILDPKYGMFKEYNETRSIWFSEDSFEDEEMYFLIGVICGLAIYNFTIINVPFPLALYKKLLGESIVLDDLADLSPVMANSLKSLLNYEGDDVEEVFCLTFEVTREVYGEVKSFHLVPGGDNVPVTSRNKDEYVHLYIDFIFNKSVEKKFSAFSDGFHKVCGGRVLKLFQSRELMAVVIGNEEYDWVAMEDNAEYKNGYQANDHVIRWFWEVFHELTQEDKKKFLMYLTGSDRIPIQGMKAVKITIQPTTDERFLPVAHTCFNLLDLPKYSTKERLKYKLLQAIQQTHGFSLV